MDSPGDNTAVIRMKRDLDAFLSTNGGPKIGKYGASTTSRNEQTHSRSSLSHSLQLKFDREKEADVLAAKSKIAELESQVCSLATLNKKARVEYEMDIESKAQKQETEIGKLHDLKSQLQFISHREAHAKEMLSECKRELDSRKSVYEQKILALQKEKMEIQEELQQSKDNSWEKMRELRNELQRTQQELSSSQFEVEETRSQLRIQDGRLSEVTCQLKELEGYKLKSRQLEETNKDLEMKVSRYEEDTMLKRTMKTQISSWEQLEKDYEKLKDENLFLKETEENNMLLKEQFEGMKIKLERAENRFAEYAKIQLENEELKSRLEKWELADMGGNKLRSPSMLSKRLAELQTSQALMLEEQGQLKSSLHSQGVSLRQLQEKNITVEEELAREKIKLQQQADLVKRLQRKLLLVTKEREGYKRILESYESEVTVNIAANTASRLQILEETLQMYRKQNDQLEAEVGHLTENQNKTLTRCQELVIRNMVYTFVYVGISLLLREKIVQLEKELEQKVDEISILESRIEQRHLQGDYDPMKTKVVHLSMNPAAIAQKQRMEELSRLKLENERLQQRVKLLEDSGGQVEDLTVKVDQKLNEPCSSKEVEEIRTQLNTAELKNKRLMEAFKKKSQEFREVCYQLMGYKIDMPTDNQYRLISMYSEAPGDYMLFQQSSSGELQMLGTPFSEYVQELIDEYLEKMNSIPAFLSKVTLDLFARQTITWE
ncbi:hypothetical protein ScPMuIL_005038 [Solemya velum]